MSQSLLAFIRLYSKQSSANSLGVDWTPQGEELGQQQHQQVYLMTSAHVE